VREGAGGLVVVNLSSGTQLSFTRAIELPFCSTFTWPDLTWPDLTQFVSIQ